MKVILVMVSSLDGKITRGDDPDIYTWTSKEDGTYFRKLLDEYTLIVMGRKTFEAANPKPQRGKLRIVVTSNVNAYKDKEVLSQLEFTNEPVKKLVKRLADDGYETLLLVGGGGLNTSFFKDNLVDELWLTLEPKILGKGKMIVEPEPLNVQMHLASFEKLNDNGTLLLKYKKSQ